MLFCLLSFACFCFCDPFCPSPFCPSLLPFATPFCPRLPNSKWQGPPALELHPAPTLGVVELMNSAELAITRIQTLLEDWLQLPSTNAPISDFRNLKIDPSEFEKAGNVRKALDDFAAYLGATAELPRLEAKLASLPTALLDKLSNTIAEVHNILHRMRDVWKADPRSGVVPPRWTNSSSVRTSRPFKMPTLNCMESCSPSTPSSQPTCNRKLRS